MKKLAMALLAAPLACAAPATAETLTFEGESNTTYSAPAAFGSFTIANAVGDEQHFHVIDSTAYAGYVVSNGTGVLYNDRDTSIVLTKTGGGSFTLNGFDVSATGSLDPAAGANAMTVQGYLGGAQVFTNTFGIGQGFNTRGLNPTIFDTVMFNANGGFQLDNIVLNATAVVPEPATWGMMLLGFGGVGAALRRRKATVRFA